MPPFRLSALASRTPDSPIAGLIRQALAAPGLISLAAGLVDEETLPAAEVADAAAAVLADPTAARAALQYGDAAGFGPLRRHVLDELCRADGVSAADLGLSADRVVVTTGSQQLLYLLAEVLVDPGDIVVAEAPSYFVYHAALKSHGAEVRAVPTDAGGLNVEALDRLLAGLERSGDLGRVKLVYTVDYFQNPSGRTLSADRRPQLVEVVRKYSRDHRILIVEDAAYRELRYDGPDLPSVKRSDPANEFVAYAGTFSKPCAPGLKTGFGILPADLVGPVVAVKGGHDFGSGHLAQVILARLIESGAYRGHVDRLRGVYRAKRDALLSALDAEFADWPGVRWARPDGGLYVWLSFPDHVDAGPDGELFRRAVGHGVLYVPGEFGHVPDGSGRRPRHEARLSFGVADPGKLAEGVRRLRSAARGLEAPSAG